MDQPPTTHRAGLTAFRDVFYSTVAVSGANPEQGEAEQVSEVPPSHWVDANDELPLAVLCSSLS